MQVIAWSENLTQDRCDEVGARLVSKEELLERSDFLTIHLLLSDRTRGLLTAGDLARMKETAYLVNTSRGPIVDESALIDVLKGKRIAGAGLDVFDVETVAAGPSAAEYAQYRDYPPSRLCDCRELPQLVMAGTVENLRSWLDGNTINRMAGRNPTTPG